MLVRRQKIWIAAATALSLGITLYQSRNIGKRYKERVSRFQGIKDEALRTGNLKLLYSPLVFFYLFGTQSSYDSAREFYQALKFFQPKLLGIDLTEQVFNARYKSKVKELDFRPRMAEAAQRLEAGEDEQLKEFGSPDDLIRLLTFSHCYAARCEVVFTDDEVMQKKRLATQRMEEVRSRAAPDFRLRSVAQSRPDLPASLRELIALVIAKIDPRKSFFERPLARTYLLIVPKEQLAAVQAELSGQMFAAYNTVLHDAADAGDSEVEERFELQKHSGRFG